LEGNKRKGKVDGESTWSADKEADPGRERDVKENARKEY
jgi:hypothetical protein